jgi:phosphohistidine phosphatase
MATVDDPATCEASAVIWLLRHGEAEDDAPDDASRRLTKKGERQSRTAGLALAKLGVELEACLTSPKVRALDTARLACEALEIDVEETDSLRGGDFDPEEVAAGRGNVLLVGHEPDFSRAIQRATGARIDMKKGGLAAIDDDLLLSLLRPRQIREIAG